MKISGLLMDKKDNVVTCVVDIHKGETVYYMKNDEMCQVVAQEDIPYCHKIALCNLGKDEIILKYGEMIGKTLRPIAQGCWVSHLNIYSVSRDYDSEMLKLD